LLPLLDLQLLSRRAKESFAQDLAGTFFYLPLSWPPVSASRAQRASGPGSHRWKEKRIRAHAKIQYRRQAGHFHEKILQEQSRLAALRGNPSRALFFHDRRLRIINENYATVPFLLLFVWVISTPASFVGKLTSRGALRVNAPEMRPATSALRVLIIFAPRRDAACHR